MSDPTTPPAEDRKKIMFYDTSDRQSKLRIRCNFDGISQSQFFRMMITGYIENDELIYNFMKKCKEKYKIQGVTKRNKIDRIARSSAQNIKKFNLGKDEIEDIFDIIETESGI